MAHCCHLAIVTEHLFASESLVWVREGDGYCDYVWSRLGVCLGVAHVMSEGFVLRGFGVAQTLRIG
jgi:hypothetical protein